MRVVADGEYVVEPPPSEFVDMLGTMCADVDADFPHHSDGLRANPRRWIDARAEGFETVTRIVT